MRRVTTVGLVVLALVGSAVVGSAVVNPAVVTSALAVEQRSVGADAVGPSAVGADAVGLGAARADETGPTANGTADDAGATLVSVGDTRIWPYVAPGRTFDRRASSINVVVRDDPRRVERYLTGRREWNHSDDEWVGDPPDETGVVGDERVPWRDAPGAARYVYVADRGWVTERYQLHRGEYFGARHHLRAYGPRDGNWTAVQAHAEHWDWFTITHTVDSVEVAQRRVESAFLGKPGFTVRRVYHANDDTYDADGWSTVVAVALAPLLGRKSRRYLARLTDRRNRRRVALTGTLAALPLVVRFGGVLCERHLPWLSPDAVVALWYPVLVAGVPLAAVALGRRLPEMEAGALASLGFGAGLVLDYASLGVAVLPIPVAAHRAVVVVAVGLIAAGAGSDDSEITASSGDKWTPALRAGAVLWVVAVVAGHLV
ncbi:hypothetical protein [Halorussus sp. MSC15.2]|uniref:hypothetical protein n=1 Tax=Halorussus sp. MSC15.2 TaxID=2283638 RepID=UPI0013D199DA|nr:hypothetical protein [Halorussus sp. MSC15.2]NEU56070.1 hypothetical protein [Halorussus sp. MSC15.2]